MELSRQEFQRLAEERLADAEALLSAGRYGGAYYVAGYAVECALKACIAKETKEGSWPPKDAPKLYTHRLDALLEYARLVSAMKRDAREMKSEGATDAEIKALAELQSNWNTVSSWSEESRYETAGHGPEADKLLRAIRDPGNGVLTWLRSRW